MVSSTLFLLLLLPLLFSHSSAKSLTLSLSSSTQQSSPTTRYSRVPKLSYMANSKAISTSTARLFGIWGAYEFSFSFGTPPQTLKLALATSGGLTYFPCGTNFTCIECHINPKEIQTFKPELSSSYAPVYCNSKVFKELFRPDLISSCADCGSNASCSAAPAEFNEYDGEGNIISESLTLPGTNEQAHNLIVGCASQLDTHLPGTGISEFGPFPWSLPAQLNLTGFSHCLPQKKYRFTNSSGTLVLYWGSSDDDEDTIYTPYKKIHNGTWQGGIYYLDLEKLLVGDVELELPGDYLATNSYGNGGVTIETSFVETVMENRMFEPLLKEFVNQVGKKYVRAEEVEKETTYRPCYFLPKSNDLPVLRFVFKGGAEMVVPEEHYMGYVNKTVACMAVWADVNATNEPLVGPSIVMGQWLMQNMNVKYDLVEKRIGFETKNCTAT